MAKNESLNARRGLLPLAKQTRLELISNFAEDTKSETRVEMIYGDYFQEQRGGG